MCRRLTSLGGAGQDRGGAGAFRLAVRPPLCLTGIYGRGPGAWIILLGYLTYIDSLEKCEVISWNSLSETAWTWNSDVQSLRYTSGVPVSLLLYSPCLNCSVNPLQFLKLFSIMAICSLLGIFPY